MTLNRCKKTELEIEIIHETVKITKVLLKTVVITLYLKNVICEILHFTPFITLRQSSEKLVTCKILHFTTLLENLRFQSLEKGLTTLQLLTILHESL